jgi:hypothetical protein
MGISTQVTFADSTTITFDALANVLQGAYANLGAFVVQVGTYLIDLIPSAPVVDQRIFHVVGADGNSIIRCGNTGGTIELQVRYVNDIDTLRGDLFNDQWEFANVSCTLNVNKNNTSDYFSFENMNLVQGSAKQIGKIRATGWVDSADPDTALAVCMVDATYTLRMDGSPTGSGSS